MCANESLGCGRDTCPLRSAAVADLTLPVALILCWTIGEGITRNPASGINRTIGPILLGKASQKQNPVSASGINTMEGRRRTAVGEDIIKNILRNSCKFPGNHFEDHESVMQASAFSE